MRKKIIARSVAVAGVLAIVGAACTSTETASQEPEATSSVRVAHFSPDAPEVDVYVDGTRVLAGVPFAAVSDYLEIPAGTHTLAVRPAGADAQSAPVLEAMADTDANASYTVAALGALADIRPGVFADDLSRPADGMAHVRALHAVPDVGVVDVAVDGVGTVVTDLAFGESSDYLPVPAGEYTFRIRATGTTDDVLTLTAKLAPGSITTAAAVGSAAGGTARLIALGDAS